MYLLNVIHFSTNLCIGSTSSSVTRVILISLKLLQRLCNIGPLNPTIYEGLEWPLQLNSVCVCVCMFSLCSLYITNFLILLQHNIRPLSCDCSPCTIKFMASVNLKTHNTLTQTVMNVLPILRPV